MYISDYNTLYMGTDMTTYACTQVSKAYTENGTTDNLINLIKSQSQVSEIFSDVNGSDLIISHKDLRHRSCFKY